jgi:hypothetical protein
MKKRDVSFIDTFEEGLTMLAVYLVFATEPQSFNYEEVYRKYFLDKSISEVVADSLNRIERLKINCATPLSNN